MAYLPTCLKYWPFILLISGFSWAANLEHAEPFHSFILTSAESLKVVLPFFQDKTWGDLNPYIVSAYPILNIAYTFMFDSSRSEDLQPVSESEKSPGLKPVSESDFVLLLQTMQAMNERQLQAMQEMQREGLKVMVETLHHLAGVKARQKPARLPSGEKQVKVSAARKGSAYGIPMDH